MSLVIHPPEVRTYQFPDDAAEGRQDFLGYFKDPAETWLRAYAFTMGDLGAEVIAAHQAGVPLHLYLDRSQEVGHYELPLVQQLVAAGVEVTIGTSYAGSKFIAHEKGYVTAAGDCWEGSTNFSDSAWSQINTAFAFNSPEWQAQQIASFNHAVEYAWTSERAYQLMAVPPASFTVPVAGRLQAVA